MPDVLGDGSGDCEKGSEVKKKQQAKCTHTLACPIHTHAECPMKRTKKKQTKKPHPLQCGQCGELVTKAICGVVHALVAAVAVKLYVAEQSLATTQAHYADPLAEAKAEIERLKADAAKWKGLYEKAWAECRYWRLDEGCMHEPSYAHDTARREAGLEDG